MKVILVTWLVRDQTKWEDYEKDLASDSETNLFEKNLIFGSIYLRLFSLQDRITIYLKKILLKLGLRCPSGYFL